MSNNSLIVNDKTSQSAYNGVEVHDKQNKLHYKWSETKLKQYMEINHL